MSTADADTLKRDAARVAAELVHDGMRLGLGTGSTVRHLLPAIAQRGLRNLRCVTTSTATEQQARELGIPTEPFDALDRLDLAIDGADQVAPDNWLVKGGGGAHLREKIVAAAAQRFVVIIDESKLVDKIHPPIPLELLTFGLPATLHALALTTLRDVPPTPDGGVIADYAGPLHDDPGSTAAWLASVPGVSDHGLFAPTMVSEVLIATASGVLRREGSAQP